MIFLSPAAGVAGTVTRLKYSAMRYLLVAILAPPDSLVYRIICSIIVGEVFGGTGGRGGEACGSATG